MLSAWEGAVNLLVLLYTAAQLGKGYLAWGFLRGGPGSGSGVRHRLLLAALYATFVGHPLLFWLACRARAAALAVFLLQVATLLYLALDAGMAASLLRAARMPEEQRRHLLPAFRLPVAAMAACAGVLLAVRALAYLLALMP